MRKRLLDELVTDTLRDAGFSDVPGQNEAVYNSVLQLVQNACEQVATSYEWPHLRRRGFLKLVEGQRLYDAPSTVDIDRLTAASIRYGSTWCPLHYGIDPSHYAAYDPFLDERANRVLNFQRYGDQIEVWPTPDHGYDSSNGDGQIMFEGSMPFVRPTSGTDVVDLDDQLVVLLASSFLLARNSQRDADMKLNLYTNRLNKLKGQATPAESFMIGGELNDLQGGSVMLPKIMVRRL